jgi:predicted nucleic acid-binding protein
VGLDPISPALAGHSMIALDTCVLVYYLEDSPSFGQQAETVVTGIVAGRSQAILATLALLELQVGPYAQQEHDVANDYYDLITHLPNTHWIPLSLEIADRAARLRAEYRIKTPDAIHVATALEAGATLFVTNDRDLPAVTGIDYLMLGP